MPHESQSLSRRELLKVMSAFAGSLAASSMVPAKWVKPALEAGVLPAHAQSTLRCLPPYSIVNCDIQASPSSDNATIGLTSHAWISPACPGIELGPVIYIRVINPQKPVLPEVEFVKTDAEGKATVNVLITINPAAAPDADMYIKVGWSFNNEGDGKGTCETDEVHLVISLPT